jgi:hypothetical protein
MNRARLLGRPPRWAVRPAAVLLAAALFGGCSTDRTLLPPRSSPGTWVAGRVTGGRGDNRPTVLVYDAGLPFDRWGPFAKVRTDDASHYAVPLRAGRYLLGTEIYSHNGRPVFYRATGLVLEAARADTIVITEQTSDTVRVDFPFTSLDLWVGVPGELEGAGFDLILSQKQPGGRFDNLSGMLSQTADVNLGYLVVRLPHVPPGTYRLQLRGEGGIETFWSPGTQDTLRADTIRVEPGETQLTYTTPGPPAVSWLEGFAPHEGPDGWHAGSVEAFDPYGIAVAKSVVGPGGEFRLGFLATSRVRLRADGVVWCGGSSIADANEFTLVPGDTVRAGPWDAGRLFVRLEREGGQDMIGLRLRFHDAEGRLRAEREGLTVGDYLLIAPLEPGVWRLHLSPREPGVDDVLSRWYDRAVSFEGAVPVEIPGGGAAGAVTVHIERGGRVRGRVAGPHGPLSWADVVVTPADIDTAWAMLYQYGSTSAFEIRGLPDGDYKIGATEDRAYSYPTGKPTAWYGETASWDSAAVVTIRDREVKEGVVIYWRFPAAEPAR